MPLYQYVCEKCEVVVELLRSIKDTDTPGCPSCGGKTEKLISSPGLYEIKGDNSASVPSNNSKRYP